MQLTHRNIVRFAIVTALAAAALTGSVTAARAQAAPSALRVALITGRSTVLNTDFDVTRIAVTNPAIADATVVQPREILIDGKAPGTISLILWGGARRVQYDLIVEAPVAG